MNISYTSEAVTDLARLRQSIVSKNPVAAQSTAREILTGIDKLKMFPNMGVQVLQASKSELIRDFFVGDYIVRYLLPTDQIVVLRLWHEKENQKDI